MAGLLASASGTVIAAENKAAAAEQPQINALIGTAERSLTWTEKTTLQDYEQVTQIALDGRRVVIAVEETLAAPTSHYSNETVLTFDAGVVETRLGSVMPKVPINAPKPSPDAAKPVLILRCRGAAPCIEEDFTHHQYPSQSGTWRQSKVSIPLPREKGRAEAAADALNRLLARLAR